MKYKKYENMISGILLMSVGVLLFMLDIYNGTSDIIPLYFFQSQKPTMIVPLRPDVFVWSSSLSWQLLIGIGLINFISGVINETK